MGVFPVCLQTFYCSGPATRSCSLCRTNRLSSSVRTNTLLRFGNRRKHLRPITLPSFRGSISFFPLLRNRLSKRSHTLRKKKLRICFLPDSTRYGNTSQVWARRLQARSSRQQALHSGQCARHWIGLLYLSKAKGTRA